MMKRILAAAAVAALFTTAAAADWAPGHSAAAAGGWHADTAFPPPSVLERYGKGRKGMRRYVRAQIREAEYRRWQEDERALRPAVAAMEDARGRCDRRLKSALESGDQEEISEARAYCSPKAYGPQLR